MLGLQAIVSLLIRPSWWSATIRAIDATLLPSFCLCELGPHQRRLPELRRLICHIHVTRAVLVVVLVFAALYMLGVSAESLWFGLMLGVLVCVAGGLVGDLAVGLGPGSIGGILGGVVGGIAYGMAGTESLNGVFAATEAGFIALAAAGGSSLGMAGGVAMTLAPPLSRAKLGQWFGFVVIGALSAAIVYGVIFGGALLIANRQVGTAAFGVVLQVGIALTFSGMCAWRSNSWWTGLVCGGGFLVGTVAAVVLAIDAGALLGRGALFGAVLGTAAGLADGALICAVFALSYIVADYVGGPRAGAVAGTMGAGAVYIVYVSLISPSQLTSGFAVVSASGLIGLTAPWWRPIVVYPACAAWNLVIFQLDARGVLPDGAWVRWNAAFWDELQFLPQAKLDDHLLLALERGQPGSDEALAYVAGSRQRWAARSAQIEMEARVLERVSRLPDVAAVHQSMRSISDDARHASPLPVFLGVSRDVAVALGQSSGYRRRALLRDVEKDLDGLGRDLGRSSGRVDVRFRAIVDHWRQIVSKDLIAEEPDADRPDEIVNPYVVGVALTDVDDVFVGRDEVAADIARQLLERNTPPLLIYGQRRMGKTSLLLNLGRLLPGALVPMFLQTQGAPTSAPNYATFLGAVARSMRREARRVRHVSLPSLSDEQLTGNPAGVFDEWLDQVEIAIGDRTAVLCLDEFETLLVRIADGHLSAEQVLGWLRTFAQHRRRFKLLVAASLSFEELRRYASYLINMKVVHLSYLKEDEARRLIEHPSDVFPLRYEPAAVRRALDLTRGHPHFVQKLCFAIVTLKNREPLPGRYVCRREDVEAAGKEVVHRDDMVMADVDGRQVTAAGRRVLRVIARKGEGAVVSRSTLATHSPEDVLDDVIAALRRRELIESVDGGYRFQVELMRRYFALDI